MTEALLLTDSDFRPLRSDLDAMDGALQAVEAAVRAQHAGTLRQGRLVDRVPGEFEGLRVSLIAGDGLRTGMRIFGNPPNTRAFLLFDGVSRRMLALMDYGVLNSLRVGASAGVAARYLAPAGARVVGLIGSGWQAPPQVAALRRAVPALERICVYSPTPAHREAFATAMTAWLGLPVEPVASAKAALHDADIVDLCAPGHFDVREPLFEAPWLKPGALVISMAARQYPDELRRHARLVAHTPPAIGPDSAAQPSAGGAGVDAPADLGALIVTGTNPRRTPNETVIYHLEGGTAHDLFIASWGYDWATARGLGRPFDLAS